MGQHRPGGERDGQVLAGLGIVRLESQGFLELADGLVGLAFLAEGGAQVVVGLGVIRFQANGFLELADRLVGAALLVEGDAEVVVGVGVIRFEAEGFLELADRLVDLAFLAEGDAETVVGLGVIRLEAEGFLVLADRLVGLAFLAERDAEVVVGVGMIRFQADGFPEWRIASSFRLSAEARPRLWWASACSGFRRRASWIGGSPRRFGLCLPGRAEVVVGVGVIRLQADRFPYWRMASSVGLPCRAIAEVVVASA